MFRGDKPGPKGFLLTYFGRAENQITPPLGGPLPFHSGELRRQRQPFCFRKGQLFAAHDPDRFGSQPHRTRRSSSSNQKDWDWPQENKRLPATESREASCESMPLETTGSGSNSSLSWWSSSTNSA